VNIADVMDEMATKLEAISGLRVYPYTINSVSAPAAIVALPGQITFDTTYGRGADTVQLDVYVFVSRIVERAGRDELAAYVDGSGASSVKAALDNGPSVSYTSCDTVTVTEAQVQPLSSGGIEFLGVVFTVDIVGQGA
jgi:hypothetical protein